MAVLTGTARCTDISSTRFRALLLAGLVVRLLALPLAGTEDVLVWKTWSYGAVSIGPTHLYGVGGIPPERGVVTWGTRHTTVDYPPVALYELTLAGTVYRWFSPEFQDSRWLTVAMKLPAVLAEGLLALLLWRVVRRRHGERAGRFAASAFWANPAMILAGSILGYLDPLMALPAIGAIVAAVEGRPIVAGALLAIACLTKAQAVFITPVVALAVWNAPAGRRAVNATVAAIATALTSAVLVLPFVAIGAWRNLVQGVGSLLRHDMLSADAANLWWIVTYALRAIYAVGDLGTWGAWTMKVRILGITQIMKLGYPNARPIATSMVLAAAAWALWRARRATDLSVLLASAAFIVHAYFVLGVQVHENHLYLAVPLLAAAAAARPSLGPVLVATSAVFALNLYLFFGLGRGFPLPPRNFTIVDATVLLSVANVALLAWHARRYSVAGRLEEAANEAAVHLDRGSGDV
ncbi:MAG: hypothetical protein A3H96_17835 [Acidobacteria bacterium RIFCSPLOWO2_02_FULL_67_36]|nr:MAG: hypothetical protein A3H96_17835 [Acidobacteria bacterium RIFCSPLOWO2_02_FULL_67_36]OFW23827.1 MAG: hypothetical protein A3G21_02770 [Acidobacteria bacterium RIFCSPLOWO2_12_FULL_66_21]